MRPAKLSQKWEYVNKVIIYPSTISLHLRAHNHLGMLLSIFIFFCTAVEPETTRILFICI